MQPAPAVVPWAPRASVQACMAAVSGPSRCSSTRGARPWVLAHGTAVSVVAAPPATAVQLQFPPSRSLIQLLLRDHRSCGRTSTTSDPRPGLPRLETPGRELLAQLTLRPRGPRSACAGAQSLPASRSHLLRHRSGQPGLGRRTRSVRARVAKFQLRSGLPE